MSDGKLIFDYWGVVDAGQVFNDEQGQTLFEEGEILQAHIMVNGTEVWAEVDNRFGDIRLGFGPEPEYGDRLSIDEAEIVWKDQFGKAGE